MPERGAVLRVAQKEFAIVVVEAARHVAGEKGDLVWTGPLGDLVVRPGTLFAACTPGLVALGMEVACDQVPKGGRVVVTLGVGKGMGVEHLSTPFGPAAVVNGWAESLVAFMWEVLVRTAQVVCAPRRPTAMSAEEATFIVVSA